MPKDFNAKYKAFDPELTPTQNFLLQNLAIVFSNLIIEGPGKY